RPRRALPAGEHRTWADDELGGPAVRQLYESAADRPGDLHADAADDDQQPDAVQRERPYAELQRAPALGVRAGQRVLRGVQRWPEHRGSPTRGTCQPFRCPQTDPAASLLNAAQPPSWLQFAQERSHEVCDATAS